MGQRTISDRLDSGDIKHLADPLSAGDMQMDQLWVDNIFDGEGPDEPRG